MPRQSSPRLALHDVSFCISESALLHSLEQDHPKPDVVVGCSKMS
jgi:hypothetical protein